MKPGEFKDLREGIGYSAEWLVYRKLADSVETVAKWDSGEAVPPEDVLDELNSMEKGLSNYIAKCIHNLEQAEKKLSSRKSQKAIAAAKKKHNITEEFRPHFVQFVYRTNEDFWVDLPEASPFIPASFKDAQAARLSKALENTGFGLSIVYMDPEAYRDWLKETGAKHGFEARQDWGLKQAGAIHEGTYGEDGDGLLNRLRDWFSK